VLSVYRYNPPSIGFAQLSAAAIANSRSTVVPSATIGSVAAAVSATSRSNDSNNNGALSRTHSSVLALSAAAVFAAAWLW
jgi:cathepsin D